MLQTLTKEDVIRAGTAAYNAGLLTAQHPDAMNRRCVYELDNDPRYHCVVGAALNRDVLNHYDCTGSVAFLRSIVHMEKKDFEEISHLQGLHDEWASSSSGDPDDPEMPARVQKAKKAFL